MILGTEDDGIQYLTSSQFSCEEQHSETVALILDTQTSAHLYF